MNKDTEIVRTSLRLNKRLYDRLAEAAETRGLTMHAEIIRRLNETVEMDDYQPAENIHTDVKPGLFGLLPPGDDLEQRERDLLAEVLMRVAQEMRSALSDKED